MMQQYNSDLESDSFKSITVRGFRSFLKDNSDRVTDIDLQYHLPNSLDISAMILVCGLDTNDSRFVQKVESTILTKVNFIKARNNLKVLEAKALACIKELVVLTKQVNDINQAIVQLKFNKGLRRRTSKRKMLEISYNKLLRLLHSLDRLILKYENSWAKSFGRIEKCAAAYKKMVDRENSRLAKASAKSKSE